MSQSLVEEAFKKRKNRERLDQGRKELLEKAGIILSLEVPSVVGTLAPDEELELFIGTCLSSQLKNAKELGKVLGDVQISFISGFATYENMVGAGIIFLPSHFSKDLVKILQFIS